MPKVGQVGMELEIEVQHDRRPPERYWRMTHDGSIHTNRSGYSAMELVSVPMRPDEVKAALDSIKNIIGVANESMGFHVHLSPANPKEYDMLLSSRFVKYAIDRIKTYQEQNKDRGIERRYANRFCVLDRDINIDRQVTMRDKDSVRYRFLNFCLRQHGTVEFRIFPSRRRMNKLEEYVKLAIDIVEGFSESSFTASDSLIIDEPDNIPKTKRTEVLKCAL